MSKVKEEIHPSASPPPPPYSVVVDAGVEEKAGTSKDGEENQQASTIRKYPFHQLYRYADCFDIFAMVIGIIVALGEGAAFPPTFLYFAKIVNALITSSPCWEKTMALMKAAGNNHTNSSISGRNNTSIGGDLFDSMQMNRYEFLKSNKSLSDEVGLYCRDYALIGIGMFIASFIHCLLWSVAGQRQLYHIKRNLFRAMLSKDAGWFDARRSGALNTVLFERVRKMEGGMTAGISITASWLGMAISGFVSAFVADWLVSIVIFSLVPLFFVIGFIVISVVRTYTGKQMLAYSAAGSVASEVLSNARTVLAFNKQEYEVKRYGDSLGESMRMGMVKTLTMGGGIGIALTIINCIGGLAFWWGNNPAVAQAGGNIMQISFCMIFGSMALCNAIPNFEVIATAAGSADEIFTIIDDASRIDNFSDKGRRLENIKGNITFQDVAFSYPSRPDRKILKSFSLEIKRGQTVALVGPSGCGKSTTVQMLLRFYDATAGKVTIDGVNIEELGVRWLRHNIGLVSQEPVLFNMTIKENIRMGALDREDVIDDEIIAACKMANAHNFISILPDGYDTSVGERGAQLSGGQKQRIAIARALISNPKILVLDEATSALDTTSEKVVQEALDNARAGRTTLVIAHRLSTIRNADVIAVIDGGVVAELGNHATLMEKGGLYHSLAKRQEVEARKERRTISDQSDNEDVNGTGGAAELSVEVSEINEITGETKRHSTRVSRRGLRTKSVHETVPTEAAIVAIRKSEDDKTPAELSMFKLMGVVLKWGRPELAYTVICGIIAALSGAVDPCFAIVLSEFIGSFCPGGGEDRILMLIGVSIGLGAFHAVLVSVEHCLFSVIGERLTKRVRCNLLGKMLRMDAAWLDRQENQPSVLTTTLATDCADIQGISGIRISLYLSSIITLGVSLIYCWILEYRITFAILGITPFIVMSSIILHRVILNGGEPIDNKITKETATIAMDAINNMRTVMSLGAEPFFLERFSAKYRQVKKASIRTTFLQAPLFGFLKPSMCFAAAIIFSMGSYFIERKELQFVDVMRIFILTTLSIPSVGRQSSAVADETQACKSAKKVMDILNYETIIDREDPMTGESLGAKELEERKDLFSRPSMGRIEFKNVSFSYPNRPNIKVLKDISFTVEPGQRVALCGTSGGGKSTIMQLIQRLYDPNGGSVLIDGADLRKANIRLVRSNIGLVAQEPVLFALTINENIAYGSRTPNERPTKEQIDEVCQQANVHGFMQKLPDGFNTYVGERGAQLSGGQKQRIAIARALVRNPAILLLDEATSALDTESERIVQEAIDLASHGRTTLTIAHRLSTIQNADKILVLDQGYVAEEGTHAELMAKQGIYYNLQLAQTKPQAGHHNNRKN